MSPLNCDRGGQGCWPCTSFPHQWVSETVGDPEPADGASGPGCPLCLEFTRLWLHQAAAVCAATMKACEVVPGTFIG